MTDKIHQYKTRLLQSIISQHSGDQETEDAILCELDHLWLSMTPEDRQNANEISKMLGSGELTLVSLASRQPYEFKSVFSCITDSAFFYMTDKGKRRDISNASRTSVINGIPSVSNETPAWQDGSIFEAARRHVSTEQYVTA